MNYQNFYNKMHEEGYLRTNVYGRVVDRESGEKTNNFSYRVYLKESASGEYYVGYMAHSSGIDEITISKKTSQFISSHYDICRPKYQPRMYMEEMITN